LVNLHRTLAQSVVLYLAIAAIWGLVLAWRHMLVVPAYRGVLAIAQGILTIQAVVGLVLVVSQYSPRVGIHFLYGILSVLVLPGAYAAAMGRQERRHALIYGIAALFLTGVAIRAMMTG